MNCWAQRYWYDLNSILKRFCETNDFNTTTSVPLTTTTMLSTTAATTTAATAATTAATAATTVATMASTTVATMASTTVAKIFPMVTNVATTIRPNFSEQCPLDHDIVPGVGVGVPKSCNYLFYDRGMADVYVGIILLIISLVMLASSLIGIVKLLSSMLEGDTNQCFIYYERYVAYRRVKIILKMALTWKKNIQPGLTPTFAQVT